jgi:hypothetical protein
MIEPRKKRIKRTKVPDPAELSMGAGGYFASFAYFALFALRYRRRRAVPWAT